MFDFLSIRKLIQSATARLSQVRAEIEALRRERDALLYAPAAKSDVKAWLTAWVRDSSEEYRASLRTSLNTVIRQPSNLSSPAIKQRGVTLTGAAQQYGESASPVDLDRAMCALMGAQINESVSKLIDEMRDWPEQGLPMKERATKVAELNQRLGKLETEALELARQAEEAGISLE